MRAVYRLLILLLLPTLALRLWWKGLRNPGYRERWPERFGRFRPETPGQKLRSPLWIHAVSVGEVAAAVPLIKALRQALPELDLLITTTTPTGRDAVSRQFGQALRHAYFPYDAGFILRRFFDHFRPCALIILETELWPNLLACCAERKIPAYLVNGRLSAGSAGRYALLGPLVSPMLEQFAGIAVQTEEDAARLRALGAPPARLRVTGSLKYDVHVPASLFEEAASLRRDLGTDRPVWIAASTRAGEETVLLIVLGRLIEALPKLLLVLAPRHPERFDEVEELCKKAGFTVHRRTAGPLGAGSVQVFLLDTMGELMKFYAAADVAFVGGSLLPFGGQNMLEPAALGIPVVTGPSLYNFAAIAERLVAVGALHVASSPGEVATQVVAWLTDSERRDAAGRAGKASIAANRGATQRTLAMLQPLLDRRDASRAG